jgi:hypothetical protein
VPDLDFAKYEAIIKLRALYFKEISAVEIMINPKIAKH